MRRFRKRRASLRTTGACFAEQQLEDHRTRSDYNIGALHLLLLLLA